jgi:hypothetical protein
MPMSPQLRVKTPLGSGVVVVVTVNVPMFPPKVVELVPKVS